MVNVVGVVGTGMFGRALAARLAQAGWQVGEHTTDPMDNALIRWWSGRGGWAGTPSPWRRPCPAARWWCWRSRPTPGPPFPLLPCGRVR